MDPSLRLWQVFLAVGMLAFYAYAWAGEAAVTEPKTEPKGDSLKTEPTKGAAKEEAGKGPAKGEPKAEKPEIEPMPVGPEGQKPVGRVDEEVITRAELTQARRQIALNQRGPMPSNDQILDQLIEQVLWQRQCERQGIRPTGDEIKAAIQRMAADLQQRGVTYEQFLQSRGLTIQEHAASVGRQIAMQRLVDGIRQKVALAEIEAEYKAHPEYYDGSRVRLSQIFVDTRDAGNDKTKLDEAKEKIEKIHAELKGGKEFEALARRSSQGRTADAGGDIGWFTRKGEIDEGLIEAVWPLEVGKCTKPIQNALGWHILKVTDRETAYLTFQGCKEGITRALITERLKEKLADLKKNAKIEKLL